MCLGVDVPLGYFKDTIVGVRSCITIISIDIFCMEVDLLALGWMADVMPNVADGTATVVHNLLHEFCYIYE